MTIQIDPSIFKAYDIRALYPKSINEDVMEDVMRAIYTFFAKKTGKRDLSIVLGHDMRVSSPSLFKIAKETLISCGATVIDIGLVPTPTIYFTVLQHGYDAGIQISASHNPKDYNGIKMVIRDGSALIKIGKQTGMPEIKENALNKTFAPYEEKGTAEKHPEVLKLEVDTAIAKIKVGDLSHLKIVADPANAMGILYLQELFDKIKTNFVPMYFELDGTFPNHQADPLQHKTLRDLQERVKKEHADLGITTDGDADRVMFINEKGEIIPATYITALIAGEILRETKNARILVDIRYTRNVQNIVSKMGGEVGYTKVGHALITEQVNTEKAEFAGESSGHYYFKEMGGCESSVRVILYVLRVLAREKKPISEILSEMRTSIESGEFNYELAEGTDVKKLLSTIVNDYKDGELNELDGIAISYPEWRFSIRTSNTEPLLRLNIEGQTEEIVHEKVKELSDKILATGAQLLE
jgi:phosphomannomutase